MQEYHLAWMEHSTMPHTEHCRQTFRRYEESVRLFLDCFPHYCQCCNGWGCFTRTYDPSPAGVSLGSGYMYDVEPCEQCEGAELPQCALCGQVMTEDGERLCRCPRETGYPHPPECWCWEVEYADDTEA